jgi:hypothetical protein
VGKVDHIVLCGGTSASRAAKSDQILRLDLGGVDPNVDLEILDISRRLSSDVPDVIVDAIEIASYVYCTSGDLKAYLADWMIRKGCGDISFCSPMYSKELLTILV